MANNHVAAIDEESPYYVNVAFKIQQQTLPSSLPQLGVLQQHAFPSLRSRQRVAEDDDEEDDENDEEAKEEGEYENIDLDINNKLMRTIAKLVMTRSMRLRRVTKLVPGTHDAHFANARMRDKEKVFIRAVFLKIGEIDTTKETFFADVFIQARWREPLFDRQLDMNTEHIKWKKYWNPGLYVNNYVGEPKEVIWNSVLFNSRQEAYSVERRRLRATFIDNLELSQFPFDTQEMALTLISELSTDEVELEEDASELSTINIQSFIDEQEWRLYRNVEVRKMSVDLVYAASSSSECDTVHPSISVLCHASRRFGFYIWNIMFVVFFISCLSFIPFAVVQTRLESRLQLTFILLLATITFKFTVNSTLPRISYLTYLDYYILTSMVFMGLMCVWHAVSILFDSDSAADKGVLIAMVVLFVIINIVFCVVIYYGAITKRNDYLKKERLHKRRMRIQQKTGTDEEQLQDIRKTRTLSREKPIGTSLIE